MKEKSTSTPFAKKSFGQNFLTDQNYIAKIIAALDLEENDAVIEIGPGRGALTEKIIESGARLSAIELDRDLIPLLNEKFGGCENFHLIEADALRIDFSALGTGQQAMKTKLVANLPYYISTAILRHLARFSGSFEFLLVMLQKEVVERITAEAGNRERGFLTVLIEAFFDAEKLFDVPPNAFRPAPKVWSSVVRLTPKEKSAVLEDHERLFTSIVSAGFAQKRKTLFNNLKNAGEILYKKELPEILLENKIDPKRRAETLSIDEWLALTESFAR